MVRPRTGRSARVAARNLSSTAEESPSINRVSSSVAEASSVPNYTNSDAGGVPGARAVGWSVKSPSKGTPGNDCKSDRKLDDKSPSRKHPIEVEPWPGLGQEAKVAASLND